MAPPAASDHIVKSYDEELKYLGNCISRMGGLTEVQIAASMEAVMKRDAEQAVAIIEADDRIDQLEHEIDQHVVRMLALRQPMAGDLRNIVSALKISSDLERIADYATNVAKRAIQLAQVKPVRPIHAIPRMGRVVEEMVKEVLDAYVERDVERAIAVWKRDEEVDEMYTSLFRELLTYMMEDPRNITPSTHLLFIAKNIERMGDHATNISETIHFMVHGTTLKQSRVKQTPLGLMETPPAVTPVPAAKATDEAP